MLPEIEQLLIIQDRDQKITKLNSDIERLPLQEEQANPLPVLVSLPSNSIHQDIAVSGS